MSNKSYGQVCPLARALDVLGDRWTLLIVRELLLGPKRFKDLLSLLPAMGPNRLSDRLAMLVDSGVIRPITAAQAAAPGYELTEHGERLRQPVVTLGLWGLSLPIDERVDPSTARAELIALCLAGASDPRASAGVHHVAAFEVGAETFHFLIDDGRVLPRSGPPAQPAGLHVQCGLDVFMALALQQVTPAAALREGRARLLRGTPQTFTQLFKQLAYQP